MFSVFVMVFFQLLKNTVYRIEFEIGAQIIF